MLIREIVGLVRVVMVVIGSRMENMLFIRVGFRRRENEEMIILRNMNCLVNLSRRRIRLFMTNGRG